MFNKNSTFFYINPLSLLFTYSFIQQQIMAKLLANTTASVTFAQHTINNQIK